LAVSIVPQEELPASSVTIVDGIPISFAIYPGADSSVVLDYVRNAFQLVDADGRDLMLLLKDYIVKNFS
jgi:hypothetical protein